MNRLDGKTAVLTGGTSGIGRATAMGLAQRGARLVVLGRDPARCDETLSAIAAETGRTDVTLVRCDLASLGGVRAAAAAVLDRVESIDVLVNNAGITLADRQLTDDGFEMTFAVNHLAYFLLTGLLLPRLREAPAARIVNVASDAHRFVSRLDLDDLGRERGYGAMRVYGESKAANILFTRELAKRLDGSGITVNALHPGGIRSNLGANQGPLLGLVHRVVSVFLKSPEVGARTSLYLATDPGVEGRSGGYFVKSREVTPKAFARDDATAARLWEISEQMTGFSYP